MRLPTLSTISTAGIGRSWVSEPSLQPGDAIKLLHRAIALDGVKIVPAYVAQDLASLRRARPDDAEFAAAVLAIASEIHTTHKSPAQFGIPIEHDLDGWRRSKFASSDRRQVHLRLIFRSAKPTGIEILAFGDREFPQSAYFTAKARLETT